MKKRQLSNQLGLVTAVVALVVALSQVANAQVTKISLQEMYATYLHANGYRPEIDGDGDVRFAHEGKWYFIEVGERDPEFFRVVLPNIWRIESATERQKVLVAADYSSAKVKVSKVFTVKDNVWTSLEVFVAKPEDFRPIFKRSLSALQAGAATFVAKMRE